MSSRVLSTQAVSYTRKSLILWNGLGILLDGRSNPSHWCSYPS